MRDRTASTAGPAGPRACNPCRPCPPAPPSGPRTPSSPRLSSHCGKAYGGRIVANEPAALPDDPFAGKDAGDARPRVRAERIDRIPFHVGDDHSRTWVITRTADGLRLKHDHRHEDGSADELTMYGGDTAAPGSARRQEFPVDAESRALFERTGRNVSMTNTWAMEIEPGKTYVYELARPGRLFRVEFDLTQPVPALACALGQRGGALSAGPRKEETPPKRGLDGSGSARDHHSGGRPTSGLL
jgi:hypothetical protein